MNNPRVFRNRLQAPEIALRTHQQSNFDWLPFETSRGVRSQETGRAREQDFHCGVFARRIRVCKWKRRIQARPAQFSGWPSLAKKCKVVESPGLFCRQ